MSVQPPDTRTNSDDSDDSLKDCLYCLPVNPKLIDFTTSDGRGSEGFLKSLEETKLTGSERDLPASPSSTASAHWQYIPELAGVSETTSNTPDGYYAMPVVDSVGGRWVLNQENMNRLCKIAMEALQKLVTTQKTLEATRQELKTLQTEKASSWAQSSGAFASKSTCGIGGEYIGVANDEGRVPDTESERYWG